jgi:HPt (histidine-containing phosphotransfer) domain-containing protein
LLSYVVAVFASYTTLDLAGRVSAYAGRVRCGWPVHELRQMQLDGEPDLLADLVEVFADDASARLEALREALIQADTDGIAKTAHTLEGSAGNLSASRMSHSAAQLEERGRSGYSEDVEDLLRELHSEFEKANAELSKALLKS